MRTRSLPRSLVAVVALVLAAPATASGELSFSGFVAGRTSATEGQPGWLEGGFGRLLAAGDAADDGETHTTAELDLTVDVRPARHFGVLVHAVARAAPESTRGDAAGVVEAYAYGSVPLKSVHVLRFKLGHFILPTSRENVEVGWSTPYNLTSSTLNTWIGEEVRPTGLQAELALGLGKVDELRLGSTVFGGNDTAGTLLAWRGWSSHGRPSVHGEVLPLPPHSFLAPGGSFRRQRDDGTRPFGHDLDGRLGYAGWLRWQRPQRATLQWTHFDNRGDRRLYEGQYSWRTQFDLVGAEVEAGRFLTFVGELVRGSTGMGRFPRPHVQIDFESAYLLASARIGDLRLTVRYDDFETVDRDRAPSTNDEDGSVRTATLFWQPRPNLRLGVELQDISGDRPLAAESGFDPDVGGRSVTLEARYYLDF